MQLLLVRHGQPDTRQEGRFVNPPLTERGHWQAARAADRLAREEIAAIVSSPLQRAYDTARPLAERLGLEVEVEDHLAEVDGGGEGTRYISLEALRREGGPRWQDFLDDPVGFLGGDTETFCANVLGAFGRILQRGEAGKVAVFTHGLPINVILAHILGIERLTRFVPHYCSLTRLIGADMQRLTILSVNDTGHFGPDEI